MMLGTDHCTSKSMYKEPFGRLSAVVSRVGRVYEAQRGKDVQLDNAKSVDVL